jgi:hypothetical protein
MSERLLQPFEFPTARRARRDVVVEFILTARIELAVERFDEKIPDVVACHDRRPSSPISVL